MIRFSNFPEWVITAPEGRIVSLEDIKGPLPWNASRGLYEDYNTIG